MAFAIWLTGPPAAGKSTIAEALLRRGLKAARLESDILRERLMPGAGYDDAGRELFYGGMVWLGRLLVDHGVSVLFDATAARRAWRDRARKEIERFLEVHVDCPLEVRAARDPKGLYRKAASGAIATLPGLQTAYEPPLAADLTLRSDLEPPERAAERIFDVLSSRGWV